VTTTSIGSRVTGHGLRQHLYSEPAVVEECGHSGGCCGMPGDACLYDVECCPGNLCNWFHCQQV
jgi:hypothetical protein